ncbi:substrate-binding domain-containing protein [Marinospirillum sp. MEB164]|uniref:Substrate-binding domain-containing protein n=1 Tax=Marinospirillum alkalitolerans TaxID=3123374 RepID=A0ABW8PVG2_9GAMM
MLKKLLFTLACCLISLPLLAADLVVIAHPSVPDGLSQNQIRDIYLGRNQQLPNGQQATPIEMSDNSPLKASFHTQVTGRSLAQLNAFWSQQVFTGRGQPPRSVESPAAMRAAVAATPGALGYLPASEVDASVKVLLRP